MTLSKSLEVDNAIPLAIVGLVLLVKKEARDRIPDTGGDKRSIIL